MYTADLQMYQELLGNALDPTINHHNPHNRGWFNPPMIKLGIFDCWVCHIMIHHGCMALKLGARGAAISLHLDSRQHRAFLRVLPVEKGGSHLFF